MRKEKYSFAGSLTNFGLLLVILGFIIMYREEIISFYIKTFVVTDKYITLESNNSYSLKKDFDLVQITDDFSPENRQDLLNIYYTVLDSGNTNFTFYCPDSYKNCISDIIDISNDQTLLSHINNMVHPFNSFKNIETEYDTIGKVTIAIHHVYTEEMIVAINTVIGELEQGILKDVTDPETIIKTSHDYIINNSKYDKNRSDNKIAKYLSDTAYGNLIQGYGICGGYADSIKIIMDKYHILNYKISSENHVWNLVYLDNNWYHLDLTWDDPVLTNGEDSLEYSFYLITNEELKQLDTTQHTYDINVYTETLEN